MSIRVIVYRIVKCFENQQIVIPLADYKRNNASVVKIQNCTEIDFAHFGPLVPLKLGNICEPFLIGCLGVKLPTQQIFSNILRIPGTPGTAVIAVFECGFDIVLSTNSQNSFVVDTNAVVMQKIVIDAAISFVRTFCVNFLYFLRKLFIFSSSGTFSTRQPSIICCPGYLEQRTGFFYCTSVFSTMVLDCSVNMALPYLR